MSEALERLRGFICAELLRDPAYPLGDDEPLISGGLIDSFSIAHVAVFIETAFAVYIPDVDLTVENMDTLRQILALIRRTREAVTDARRLL